MRQVNLNIVAFACLLQIASCGGGPNDFRNAIHAQVTADRRVIFTIANLNKYPMYVDDPRAKCSRMRLDWRLVKGNETVATSETVGLPKDLMLFGHLSSGPIEITRGDPFTLDLQTYYPVLKSKELIDSADSLLWSCYILDEVRGVWLHTSGVLSLR